MTLDEVVARARERGFADTRLIRQLARGAVSLRPNGPTGAESQGSRLGGLPALPPSVPWPRHDGRSLAFVAQVDLGAQPRAVVDEGLPGDGLLLFFYDAEQSTWGFDPKDLGSFAVIYVSDPTETVVVPDSPPDVPEHARYRACGLMSQEVWTLPPWESVLVDDLRLNEDQMDAYQNVLESLAGDDGWASRCLLGGYPDQIQGDMMLECALVSAGLYCGDATAYQNPRLPEFRKDAGQWRLLLQVPSTDAAGMMWGDVGCLYYWIRDEDLRARRFERTWMILQCS